MLGGRLAARRPRPWSPPCRITAPKRKDDVKVVAALVLSMLKYFEKQTGQWVQGQRAACPGCV